MTEHDSRSLDILLDEISVAAKSEDFESASILVTAAKKRCAIDSEPGSCSTVDRAIELVIAILSNCESVSYGDVQIFRYSAGCFLSEMLLRAMRHGLIECAQKWIFEISLLLVTALPSRK